MPNRARVARDCMSAGSSDAITSSSVAKSSAPPCAGSAQASSSLKSGATSRIRHAWVSCSLLESLISGERLSGRRAFGCQQPRVLIASASASIAERGRTITVSSSISPSCPCEADRIPCSSRSPTRALNSSAWSPGALRADLALVVKVLEYAHDAAEDQAERLAPVVGAEHDGAVEHDLR